MVLSSIDRTVIEMIDRNIVEFYVEARRRPWADIKIDDDVVWGATGLPIQAFNGAVAATFSEDAADGRIATILAYFRELKIDMSWWVGPTSPAWLGDRLIAHGLVLQGVAPAMAVALDRWIAPAQPGGIEIEQANDSDSYHDAIVAMFEGFDMPRDVLPQFEERFRDYSVGMGARQRTYVARLDGQPVGTSLGFVFEGIVAVYNVATVPSARRRGVGAAVTAAAIADGRAAGARWAILESSEMGRSVYEGLGFRQVAEVAYYGGNFSGELPADGE